ncbi:substrate-binding domain-containing protein [Litorilinea aerophila]|nr:extracellular solute-binding protein [Litorilinea aerophila]MCC9078379.1 substrate-binding domain-containing protein [Litorilinea aerophila]
MFTSGQSKRGQMSRRHFLQLSAAVGGAALVSACAPSAPGGQSQQAATGSEAAAPPADTQVVVEAWAHWEQGLQWLEDAMKNYGFTDEHPNISLNKVVAPFNEIHDKMLAACASGVGVPDIMRVEQGRMAAFFKGQEICFVDLTDLIGDKINDLVLGSAVDYWSWQGAIYGIGNEMNACTLAYRKAVFDELGIETPFKTWEDLKVAGEILKREKDMYIISFHDLHDGDFQIMLYAAGGLMFDENGDFGGLNDLGKEILEYQRSMVHDLGFATIAPVTGDSTWSPPIYWEAFRQNQIATTMGAPWHNGKLGRDDKIGPGQEGEWRLQELPGGIGEGLPTATHGGTSVSIPKLAQHPEEAWMIIEFTHLTRAVLEDTQQRGIIPTYKPVLTDPILNEPYDYYGGQVIGELYLKLADAMPRIYQSPWAPEFHTAFQNIVLTPVLQDNNQDYDTLFADLETELQRIKSM